MKTLSLLISLPLLIMQRIIDRHKDKPDPRVVYRVEILNH